MGSPWPRHQHELSQAAPDSPQRGPRHLAAHLQLPRGALQKETSRTCAQHSATDALQHVQSCRSQNQNQRGQRREASVC